MGSPFGAILDVANLMQGFGAPWFVSGGWAIDLFVGEVTREHSDIEIGIYRCDQHALWRQLPGRTLDKAIQTNDGGKWVPWPQDEELRLPVHQIRATCAHAACKEFEFFLNERTDTHWASRRHPGLLRGADEVASNSFLNIPILAPEIQLLFKAKKTRAKDQSDFEKAIPRLSRSQIQWLKAALREYHPDHPWLGPLGLTGTGDVEPGRR
jgi:Aminoglycoside-2''-adenylyltransferase